MRLLILARTRGYKMQFAGRKRFKGGATVSPCWYENVAYSCQDVLFVSVTPAIYSASSVHCRVKC